MITIEDLKERWFEAYPEVMGISGDKPIQCYAKKDVDECLAEIEVVPRTDNSAVIAKLLDERRWRKFSEEKPEVGMTIIVSDGFCIDFASLCFDDTLDMHDDIHFESLEDYPYWMPRPLVPSEVEKEINK